jgi:hypothetical protein
MTFPDPVISGYRSALAGDQEKLSLPSGWPTRTLMFQVELVDTGQMIVKGAWGVG